MRMIYKAGPFPVFLCIVGFILIGSVFFHAPSAFYMWLRVLVFVAAGIGLIYAHQAKETLAASAYSAIGVLFNPMWPLHFTRPAWGVIDVLSGAVFLYIAFTCKRR